MTAPETPSALTRPITIDVPTAVAQKLTEWHDGPLEHAALTALRLYHGLGPAAHAQLLQAAQTLNTSPAKALRTAVERLAEQANKIKLTAARGRPAINQERDTAIFLRITEGATQAEVAHAFSISLVRVGQIMAQQRALRGVNSRRAHKQARAQAPDLSTLFDGLDSGMPVDTAATTFGRTVEQIERAYAAYKDELPANPTKGDRASATFAGLHALDNEPEPEVLSLEDSTPAEPPRKLVIIPPSMRNQTQPQPHPHTQDAAPVPERTLQELQQDFDDLMGEL
jgi:hypothetical protein